MIELYTDWSAINNPWPWGRGAIVKWYWSSEKELSGCEADSTNNRMELMAVIQWLSRLLDQEKIAYEKEEHDPEEGVGLFSDPMKKDTVWLTDKQFVDHVHIFTDSTYVQKWITEWMATWLRRSWRRSKWGQLVKNADLWKQLNSVVAKFDSLERSWVKAHVGHEMNERVDDLAREAAIKQ